MPVSAVRQRVNTKFKWVLENGLWAPLKTHQFKRKGFQYWRDLGTAVTHAVAPNRSPWAESSEVDFTLDCGVTVHAFWDLYPEGKWSRTPSVNGSQIYARPASISGFKLARNWWRLNADETEESLVLIAREIRDAFTIYVLPWFDRFQTSHDVGDYLASPKAAPGHRVIGYRDIVQSPTDLRNAAIAYFAAGEYERALKMLDLAATTIDRHGKGHTTDLRERMERLIARREAEHARP